MIAVLDIGNSTISVGIFDGDRLFCEWKMLTQKGRTWESYAEEFSNFLIRFGLSQKKISGIALGSVVRELSSTFLKVTENLFELKACVIEGRSNLGLKVLYDDPNHVGIDRLAVAVATYYEYGGPVIVVDIGTAITVDVVSQDGNFLGGIIAPGLRMSAEVLHEKTDLLPLIEINEPLPRLMGQSTPECVRSGVIYGSVAMIDGLVGRIRAQIGLKAKVVATGGYSELIKPISETIEYSDTHLVLKGLRLIYLRETVRTEQCSVLTHTRSLS